MNFVQNRQRNTISMKKSVSRNGTKSSGDSSDVFENDTKKKSVEDLINGSHDVIGAGLTQALSFTSGSMLQSSPTPLRRSPVPLTPSPIHTLKPSSLKFDQTTKDDYIVPSFYIEKSDNTEDSTSKSSEGSNHNDSSNSKSTQDSIPSPMATTTTSTTTTERPKNVSKLSERAKKKSWYNVLYPSYKSRSEDFKKLFKGVPDDERLIVDYSCAVQRDILVHGRLYVSQNYLCFYANIFRWETCLCIKWKDVTAITKEKTARVIPNAILVSMANEKHFITSFTSRDKAYLMLFRVWQNALMGKPMQPQEMWQWVHNCYGNELGLTSDDEDYIDPTTVSVDEPSQQLYGNCSNKSAESVSEDHSEPQSDSLSSSTKITKDNVIIKDSSIMLNDSLLNVEQKLTHRKVARKRDETSSSCPISEQLPTDMSDSSDSEIDKNVPFVSTAECNSMHEGRQLVHTILPINVDTLFSLLFSKSKFLVEFHNNRKTTNMQHGEWETNDDDGRKIRTVNLTVSLTQSVGPKCSHVTESQIMRDCCEPSQLYSIDITSVNAGIPYADSFYVFMHYCLVRTVDDHTMFSVHAQIKYKKSVWGVVKGFIEKNAWAGLEDFYTALLRALQTEYCIPPAKSKGRRPRKGTALNQRPHEESPNTKAPLVNCTTGRIVPLAIKIPKVQNTKYEWLFWFIAALLFSLILLNVILYCKLWTMENNASESRLPDFTLLKNLPTTQNDWINLLKQQDKIHKVEIKKWQYILQTSIEMLRQIENSLQELLTINHAANNLDLENEHFTVADMKDHHNHIHQHSQSMENS